MRDWMGELSALPLGLYEKAISNHLPWEEKLRLVKDSGFDFLEMSIDATKERMGRLEDPDCIYTIRRAVEATNCPVCTLALTANRKYPLGSEDAVTREKGKQLVSQAISFAASTGIRLLHLAAYDELGGKQNAATRQNFVESLKKCVDTAAGYGVILALETMDTDFMDSGYKIMQLIRLFDTPYLQCYTDIGNLTASGIDVLKDMIYTGKHIVGIHLKDTKPNIYRDVKFGEGNVDFPYCFQVLEKLDYRGFLVAEMWSYDDERFHPYLKEASSFLRRKMGTLENMRKEKTQSD